MRRLTLLLIPIAVILIPAEAPAPTSLRPTIAWPAAVKRVVFVCADIITVRAWRSASAAAHLFQLKIMLRLAIYSVFVPELVHFSNRVQVSNFFFVSKPRVVHFNLLSFLLQRLWLCCSLSVFALHCFHPLPAASLDGGINPLAYLA
jgi:hypothetical protein